ncbi:MAG TPA: septum formation initiator family protein [Gemmatimonadaceae bacterium]|nr:septum formation initiator family protein [Gemmatimonadaceae bacterium]
MRRRLIWGALVLGALLFALQAGEYSTLDIMRQHRRIGELSARGDSLQHAVDSLTQAERLVRTDTATQERIAREEFGMVRGDEILYRFIQDSSATRP